MIEWIDDFLSHDECDHLITLAASSPRRKSRMRMNTLLQEDWKRAFDILPEDELETRLRNLDGRIAYQIECLTGRPARAHLVGNFYEYTNGGFYKPHGDAHRISERDGKVIATRYAKRDVSAIVYLNEDFTGGELLFIHSGRKIIPRQGGLVLFTSGWQNDHGVTPVAGTRYCVANWFETTPAMVADIEEIPEPYASNYPLSPSGARGCTRWPSHWQ